MDERATRIRNIRWICGMVCLTMLAYAAAIVWIGHITISGKHHGPTTYTGSEAREWAGLFACFGLSLLGAFFNRPVWLASWMTAWIALGVALVLGPAFLAR